MDEQNKGVLFAAALGLPLVLILTILMIFVVQEDDAATACDTGMTGTSVPAAFIDPTSVPSGPVAGYSGEQLVNAAYIMKAAADRGLSLRDQQIGVMTAMGESGLRILDYGDGAGPDSRGLFQQRANGAWGSYADRMDPYISATNFFKVLATIPNRETTEPTIVAHRVQRNADPYHYTRWWQSAVQVVSVIAGGPNLSVDQASIEQAGAASTASLGCAAGASYGDGSWALPIPGAPVTSDYGPRSAPVAGASSFHEGTDFGASCGTQFRAIGSGLVISAGPATGYGHWIRVDHGNGVISEYGHMYANGILTRVGERVSTGQVIGLVGADGFSSGCHLHLTIRVNGKTVDPEKFLASAPAQTMPVANQQQPGPNDVIMAQANVKGSRAAVAAAYATGPDFVTFDEVSHLSVDQIAARGYASFRPAGGNDQTRSTAIAWRADRWRLTGGGRIILVDDGPQEWDTGRAATWARFTGPGGQAINVIAVHHMINPAKFGPNKPLRQDLYAAGMRRLQRLIAALSSNGPVLVGGDFNSQYRDNDPWGPRAELGAIGMRSTFDVKGPVSTHDDGGTIDYIFFQPQRGSVVQQATVPTASDHHVLVARLGGIQ